MPKLPEYPIETSGKNLSGDTSVAYDAGNH